MKNLLLSFALAFFSLTLFAQQVITVSNRSGENAMYNNIQDAINAATPGDTIYISGSENNYGSITVNKEVHLIGPGYNPQKDFSLKANLSAISINADASKSSFTGLIFSSISDSQWASDIRISGCDFSNLQAWTNFSNLVSKNWLIENNIIRSTSAGWGSAYGDHQFIFRNNILFSSINSFSASIISNNIFILSSIQGYGQAFNSVNLCTIYNNIFYGKSPGGTTNSVFSNNITFETTFDNLPYGNNTGGSNLVGVDPQFVNVPAPLGIFPSNFSYTWDFSLSDNSAGKNAGSDGEDIGVFGGFGYNPTGEPALPVVTSFTIINAVINPNGKLNIQVEGRANN